MLRGIDIILYKKIKTGEDAFHRPIFEEEPVIVKNVLVAPVLSDDIVNKMDLDGKKGICVLAVPKGDTNNWEDVEVEFLGHRWKTFGTIEEGIESLIPLYWSKKVKVERYA